MARELGKSDFIIGYRFSPEEIEKPGIRFEETMFLLDKLATEGLDYLHFSMGSWSRNSIVNPGDKEPLIRKYRRLQSDALAQVPVIGVGGVARGHLRRVRRYRPATISR